MAITTARTSANGRQTPDGNLPPRPRAVSARRRQTPLIVVGVLLVVGFALAFTDASLHLGTHQEVLVVDQPVAAGQILAPGDLRPARLSMGSGVQAVPVGQESTVVGRRVAVPLVAGALLTSAEVGSPPPVGSGSDVVAVGLKAGSYPPEVAAGDRVDVVPVTSSTSNTGSVSSGSPVGATVLAVEAGSAGSDSPTVFSLQVSDRDATEVASLAAAGEASLIEVGAGS